MGRTQQIAVSFGAFLAFGTPVVASETAFIGRVENVVAYAAKHPKCETPCPPESICVTNSCGCAEASVVPTRALVGELPSAPIVVGGRLGEWCRLPIPPGSELLVQRMPNGEI